MSARGFTLLELMVVVAVVGIIATSVIVGGGFLSGDRRAANEADRLVLFLSSWCDSADRSGIDLGLNLSVAGYQALMPALEGWEPATLPVLSAHKLPDGLRLRARIGETALKLGDELSSEPQTLCAGLDAAPALTLDIVDSSDKILATVSPEAAARWTTQTQAGDAR